MLSEKNLEDLKEEWSRKQEEYKLRVEENDLTDLLAGWKYVGGLDISFIVGDCFCQLSNCLVSVKFVA